MAFSLVLHTPVALTVVELRRWAGRLAVEGWAASNTAGRVAV